jgi:hypothetical protein
MDLFEEFENFYDDTDLLKLNQALGNYNTYLEEEKTIEHLKP